MQARVNQTSRYGRVLAFSGIEFVKHDWRKVPADFEEAARTHDYLEVREGKAEKDIVAKQVEDAVVKTTKAKLDPNYKEPTLRSLGGHEYVKTEWRDVPAGDEDSARKHELLIIWEIDQPEPGVSLNPEDPAKQPDPVAKLDPATASAEDKTTATSTPKTNKNIFGAPKNKDKK